MSAQVRSVPEDPAAAIVEVLDSHQAVFGDKRAKRPRWVPRATFFSNAVFRILPTAEEIRDGILVAGHRFYPYVSNAIEPRACRLVLPGNREAERIQIARTIKDLMPYFALLGDSRMIDLIDRDQPGNGFGPNLEQRQDTPCALTVFDLK